MNKNFSGKNISGEMKNAIKNADTASRRCLKAGRTMDDISEKLSALLSDPDGMERIKSMAQNLLGNKPEPQEAPNVNDLDIDIGALTGILKKMKGTGANDSRINLLLALKPNLSPEKQARVDSAIKILKLIEFAPILKDMGLFS